ncbi:uncharacterized protein LOC131931012 [Physella acuta]|uniref:uncharacterized protein LOC131931012 n=1 Tax=Physella acuta TaxID=109671 RepID=UPI0027DE7439|nr:uncharacterized protein LOC131931012 [Physella acuta]
MSKADVLSNYGNAMPSYSFMGAPPSGATALMEHCYMDGQGQHKIPRKISTVSLNRELPNGITKPKEPNYQNGHAHHETPRDEPLFTLTTEPPKETNDQHGDVQLVALRGGAEDPLITVVNAGIEAYKGVIFRKGGYDNETDEPLLKFTREPPKEIKDQHGHVQFVTLSQDDNHTPNGATHFPEDRRCSSDDNHRKHNNNYTTKWSRVKNCLKKPITSTVISLLSIGLCIVSIVLVMTSPPNEQPRNLTCVECAVLNRTDNFSTTLRQMLKTVYQDGKELCCAENNQQLSALISFTVKEQTAMPTIPAFEKNVNIAPYSISNASMHMKLVPSHFDEEKYFDVPQFHPTNFDLNFEPDEHNPLLEHRRNVEVNSEGVTIQLPGLYLVYSSVHFKPDSALPCKLYEKQTWSLSILRTKGDNPTPDTILTATHTCCDECTRNQETGYTAGVFVLNADDVIKVDVSGEGLVSYRPQSTYFGLTMLGTLT